MRLRLLILALLAFTSSTFAAPEKLAAGKGRFDFKDWDGPALPVWYHAPKSLKPTSPVLFVMHGQGRNGDEYRDQWSELAEKYGFLLLVPTFAVADFPERAGYNFGNVFTTDGRRRPASQWGYTAIERIFDHAKAAAGLTTPTYVIYGHSAGAQFVHRMPFFLPAARVTKLVPANAGAYMLPDFEHAFPYGLKDSGITEADLKAGLQKPVVVLLGEADMDPNHKSIPKAPEAMTQGLHRFARGLNYFKLASEQAVRLGVPFGWKIATAPGVGHSNTNMAAFAADQLFGK
jgi:poly(3-hydroxybutyrate) depolymerase